MKKVFLFLCFVELFSCIRAEKNSFTKVTFLIPNQIKKQTLTAQQLNPNGTINPASLADINCYAVLVSGPERLLRQNTCSYKTTGVTFPVGFYAGGFYSLGGASSGATTTFGLDIPSGIDRAISLIGFQVVPPTNSNLSAADICSQFKSRPIFENFVSDPYILAEATQLDMPAGGTQTVNMKAVFNSTYLVADCKGPGFDSESGQSPPAKFGIFFQDGVGNPATVLKQNSCVGLKIQLQDLNGNRADISSNPTIKAIIKNSDTAGHQIGNFYRPGQSADACNSANMINAGSSDISIAFNNNNTGFTFSDNGLFFKPVNTNSGVTTQVITVTDAGSSIPMAASNLSFSFDSSTTAQASKYAIFDFFNNKSSASTVFGSPNIITAGQCREGYLQFLDTQNVPMTVANTNSGSSSIQITSNIPGQIQYFPTSADCSSGTASMSNETILFSASADLSTARFYYKVNSSVANFGFRVVNLTGGTPVIISGDLAAASNNFWWAK